MNLKKYAGVFLITAVLYSCGSDNSGEQVQADSPEGQVDVEFQFSDFNFSPDDFQDRMAQSDSIFCIDGVVPQEILDDRDYINSLSISLDATQIASVSAFHVCDGVFEEDSFNLPDGTNDFQGYFYVKTTHESPQWYWAYIFSNDEDITSDVLGERNLFQLNPGEEIVINHIYNMSSGTPNVVSVLLIDVNSLKGAFNGGDSILYSTKVGESSTVSNNIEVKNTVLGIESVIDPYPEIATYAIRDGVLQFVFSEIEGGIRETIDFSLFDVTKGLRVPLRCGAVTDSNSDIITVLDSDADATRVNCENIPEISFGSDVLLGYRYNLFRENHTSSLAKYTLLLEGEFQD